MPTSSSSDLELPDLPETPDTTGAYPRLTDEQMMLLSQYGERKRLTKGTTLFCEGDRDCGLFVVLDGRVRVVQENAPEGESRVGAADVRSLRLVGGHLQVRRTARRQSTTSSSPPARSNAR